MFEPYTKEAHTETFDWIARHCIFAEGAMGHEDFGDFAAIGGVADYPAVAAI